MFVTLELKLKNNVPEYEPQDAVSKCIMMRRYDSNRQSQWYLWFMKSILKQNVLVSCEVQEDGRLVILFDEKTLIWHSERYEEGFLP